MGMKRSIVLGVGINDWDTSITNESGKSIPEYLLWRSMLVRCFGGNKISGYEGVSCDKSWFSFKKFINDVSLIENYDKAIKSGWALDKDILIDENKIYSPDRVCFVPKELNNIFKGKYKNNDGLPSGVSVRRGGSKFYVSISINGKSKYLGTFQDINEAEYIFRKEKSKHIRNTANKWRGVIANNVYDAMIRKATTLAELKEM